MREVEQKYVTEVQGENSGKFNYYTKCISDKNIRIENKKLKMFVARSSCGPSSIVQNSCVRHPSLLKNEKQEVQKKEVQLLKIERFKIS